MEKPSFTRSGGAWNWIRGLSDPAFDALNDAARSVRLLRGEMIYRRGEKVSAIYQIISGRMSFSVFSSDGKELRYVHMVEGDCFGELNIFDGKPAHHDGEAITDTVLMRLDQNSFHQIRRAYPEINESLLHFFARRVRSIYKTLDDAVLLDVPHRLARRLWSLYLTQKRENLGSHIQVSHDDLAKMIGCSRQSVTLVLKEWERAGWLLQSYGAIELLKPNLLVDLVDL